MPKQQATGLKKATTPLAPLESESNANGGGGGGSGDGDNGESLDSEFDKILESVNY